MDRCIYCTKDANGREHWFPHAFGHFRGSTLLLNRLCRGCNIALGHTLDEEIARTGPTTFHRELLGIRGRRSHKPVNPFTYRAASARPPTRMMMPAPHGRYEVLGQAFRSSTGRRSAKTLRQVVVEKEGVIHCVPFSRGWAAEQLLKALRERSLEDAALVEIYLDEDEGEESREPLLVLSEVFKGFRSVPCWGGLAPSGTPQTLRLESGVNTRYFRAIAKIAFHYLLWAQPDRCTGREDTFGPIREFIRDGIGDHKQFVQLAAPQFIPALHDGLVPKHPSHFLFCQVSDERVFAFVQFFVGPDDLPPPSAVNLSRAGHPGPSTGTCHQLRYYSQKRDGFDGELIVVPESPDR